MSIVHDELKKEVVSRLTANHDLRNALTASSIRWKTPVVGIQDILLEVKPQKVARTFTGMRTLTDEEYAPILKSWEENFIGGSAVFAGDCESKTWSPPGGSELFLFQRIEHGWNGKAFEFYLLRHKGKNHFLAKLSGDENNLRVLGEDEDETHFNTALKNVLMWKPQEET